MAAMARGKSTFRGGPCSTRRAAVAPATTSITASSKSTHAGCSWLKSRSNTYPMAMSCAAPRTAPQSRSPSSPRRLRRESAMATAIKPRERSSRGKVMCA